MPTIPPAPPLPPISCFNKSNLIDPNNNNYKFIASKVEFKVCLWAINDPEIQRACFFNRTCLNSSPRECSYMKVDPILQTGPTCGLCALSMLYCGYPTADELLQKAIKLKFSNNGEMFSAHWLLQLLKDNLNVASVKLPERIRSYIYDGFLNSDFIKEKLRQHCMLLVPYDADKNHSPCMLSGHKAHWTLICGYLIDDLGDFHVFARHGKTKNLGLFSLKDLSDSNSNLNEFAQPEWHPNDTFLLPDGGIDGTLGLKCKSIVVEGLSNEIVKVI